MFVALHPEARRSIHLLCDVSLIYGVIGFPVWYRRRAYLRELLDDDGDTDSETTAHDPDRKGDTDGLPSLIRPLEAHPELTPRSGALKSDDWLQFIPAGPIGYLN